VVGTPHAAGGTFDTQERSSLQVAKQVVEVLQGKPPQNRVN
jgi:D-3-phosphoglycerate dehydrogenase